MYLITNRALIPEKKGLDVFAKTPNPAGPNELRLMRVTKRNKRWEAKVIIDKLTPARVKALKNKHNMDLDISKPWHGSLKVACELFDQARRQKKSILFFIHGYNNDVEDVIETADQIEKLYEVIVVPFTWPANGGGAISGTASYFKGDAVGNESLKYIFNEMFNGRAVEHHLKYWPDNNSYKLDSRGIESINQDHA